MQFCSLASGSTGNCYYIGDGYSGLLVDAGISAKAIEQGLLGQMGIEPQQLQGILITHEHHDHIKSVGTLARRYGLPIFATQGTWQGMGDKVGKIPDSLQCVLPDTQQMNLGSYDLEWFSTHHDAQEPVSYVIHHEAQKIGIATDTGVLNPEIIGKLYNSQVIVIEANHDIQMLKSGRYPYYLKQRILGDWGHLSNEACGQGLQEMIGGATKHVVLAHLSQENNLPQLAHQTVKNILLNSRLSGRLNLWVASAQQFSVPLLL